MKNSSADDGRQFVYLAAAVSALAGMFFGYDIGVTSRAILFIKNDFHRSPGIEVLGRLATFWLYGGQRRRVDLCVFPCPRN
jgi:uncharacterized membrane protein